MLFKEFNLVEGFVSDWMHGVCLGLVKNLLALWFNGEHKTKDFYIGNKVPHCFEYNVIPLCMYIWIFGIKTVTLIQFQTCMFGHHMTKLMMSGLTTLE